MGFYYKGRKGEWILGKYLAVCETPSLVSTPFQTGLSHWFYQHILCWEFKQLIGEDKDWARVEWDILSVIAYSEGDTKTDWRGHQA